MKTSQKDGLRDRKRRETRARLEDAAVTLVLRDGLEQTTIGTISELANVSPRTFFNYFDSKDSAIMGRRPEITDEAVSSHVEGDDRTDLVGSVVHLLVTVMEGPARPTIREDRMEIVRRYPQILAGQLAQMTLMAGRLSGGVQLLLARDPRFAGLTSAEQAAHADLMLAMCGGAVRVAMRQWAQAGLGAADEDLERRAVLLVKEMVGKLR